MIDNNEVKNEQVQVDNLFVCPVYQTYKPEFLTPLRELSQNYIANIESKLDKIYPVLMSSNFHNDEKAKPFVDYILEMSWHILTKQGYDMQKYSTTVYEMWCQEHHQYSGQEEHIHPHAQISGFYFMDVPKESQRVVFHDPRQAKVYANLLETNSKDVTIASQMVNYQPTPGMLIFTNSWLPHSFTRNPSRTPFRFIHFNIGVSYMPPVCETPQQPEVI
jgi:uncharacterized protein (TIGR02466 family)